MTKYINSTDYNETEFPSLLSLWAIIHKYREELLLECSITKNLFLVPITDPYLTLCVNSSWWSAMELYLDFESNHQIPSRFHSHFPSSQRKINSISIPFVLYQLFHGDFMTSDYIPHYSFGSFNWRLYSESDRVILPETNANISHFLLWTDTIYKELK